MAINPMNDEHMILRVLLDCPEGNGLTEEEVTKRVELMRAKAIEGALYEAWARGETTLVSTEDGGRFIPREAP